MGIRQWWRERSTAMQIALVLGVLVGVVVVTVVGAAVVGAFVLGVGEPAETAPQASFSADSSSSGDAVTIVHEAGDSIDAARLTVEVGDRTVPWSPSDGSVDHGDELVVEDVESGTDITLVWTDEDGAELVIFQYVV